MKRVWVRYEILNLLADLSVEVTLLLAATFFMSRVDFKSLKKSG